MNVSDIKTRLNSLQQAEYGVMSAQLQQEAVQSLARYPIHYSAKTIELLKAEYQIVHKALLFAEKRKTAALLEVNRAITALQPTVQEVFRLRYIDRLKWDDIAEKTCYSIGYVQRLHKQATEALVEK